MSQDPEQYPKTGVGEHQEEQIIRDFQMHNYHINSHKMRFLKNVIDITDAHRLVDDFDDYNAVDGATWIETVVGAGTAALTNMVNGVLLLTTAGAENDAEELAKPVPAFLCADCFPLYAEIRFKVSEVIQSDFWFGLVSGKTWFTPPDDAIVFDKVDGNASIRFITRTGAAQTLTDTTIDLVDNTWIRLGFHWDGADTIRYFVIADGTAPQVISAAGQHTTHICQDTNLALGFGIMTGETATKALYIDYVKCVQLRVIE